MKTLMQKIEDLFVAITFAESGEYDTARELLGERAAGPSSEDEALEPTCETA